MEITHKLKIHVLKTFEFHLQTNGQMEQFNRIYRNNLL
jgi:hypothetical protein